MRKNRTLKQRRTIKCFSLLLATKFFSANGSGQGRIMKKITLITILFILLTSGVVAQLQEEVSLENLNIKALTSEVEIAPCQEAQFFFDLTNTGAFQDTFDLGVDPFAEYSSFNMNPVVLLPGETKRIILTTTAECGDHGEFEVFLLAQSRWSSEIFESENSLTILPTDIPVIGKGIKRIQVDYGTNVVELPIENLGNRETTYLLSIEGPEWVAVEPKTLAVPATSITNLRILTRVDNATKQGSYEATIVVTVEDTGIEYARAIEVKLKTPTFIDDLFSIYLHFTIGSIVLILIVLAIIFKFKRWLKNTKEMRAEKKRLRKEEKVLKVIEKEEKKQLKFQENIQKKKEKELAKQTKKQEKEEAKYNTLKEKVKAILLKTFPKEYKLVPKERVTTSRKWIGTLLVILAIIILAGLAYFLRQQLKQYLSYFVSGIAAVIVLFIVIKLFIFLRRRYLTNKLVSKDVSDLTESVKEEYGMNYNIISKQALRKFKGKRTWVKPTLAILILLTIAIVGFVVRNKLGMPAKIVSGIALALVVIMLLVILWGYKTKSSRFQKVEFGTLQPYKNEQVDLNWKKGLGEFVFKLKNKAESALLSVKLWKKQPTFLSPQGKVYQFFEVRKVNIDDNNIDTISFRFKVKKSWLKRHKIASDKVSLLRYGANKWIRPRKLDIVQETKKFIFYEALHHSFSHFAIIGKEMTLKLPAPVVDVGKEVVKKQEKKKVKKVFTLNRAVIGYILIALAVILGAVYVVSFYSATPVTPTDTDLDDIGKEIEELTNEIAGIEAITGGIPAQTWQENTPWQIDLGKYFSDPDGDALLYSNSPVNHITITYEENTAIITPNQNWAGEEVVVFTATDTKGSSVDSNLVTLTVTKSPTKKAIAAFFSNYGTNLILGIIVLVVLIATLEIKKRMSAEE